ncbi:hypothetical protein OEZ86_009434 [Tetradesmus obliquus]|nr:hypothetical protein OEZ86_009434 [Tetradesmus obliquus]
MAALSLNVQIGDETIEDVVQKINYFERSLVVAATSEERLALTKLLAELRARENQLRSEAAAAAAAAAAEAAEAEVPPAAAPAAAAPVGAGAVAGVDAAAQEENQVLADLEAFFGVTGFFVVMARLARRLGGKYTGACAEPDLQWLLADHGSKRHLE